MYFIALLLLCTIYFFS